MFGLKKKTDKQSNSKSRKIRVNVRTISAVNSSNSCLNTCFCRPKNNGVDKTEWYRPFCGNRNLEDTGQRRLWRNGKRSESSAWGSELYRQM